MNIGGDGQNVWPWAGLPNPKGHPTNDNLHFDLGKLRQWETVFDHAQRKGILLHFVLNDALVGRVRGFGIGGSWNSPLQGCCFSGHRIGGRSSATPWLAGFGFGIGGSWNSPLQGCCFSGHRIGGRSSATPWLAGFGFGIGGSWNSPLQGCSSSVTILEGGAVLVFDRSVVTE